MSEQQDEQIIGRRRLLRRAGTVAAGVAGAGVVSAATAGPVQAAPGEPVLQGRTVSAGPATTGVISSGSGATLELSNTRSPVAGLLSPALRLVPGGEDLATDAPLGSIGIDSGNNIRVTAFQASDGKRYTDFVHTSGNANRIVPIKPQRVIDTRYADQRARIINPTGNLDTSGQLLSGKTIYINLSDFMFVADAIFGNITVVSPPGNAVLTVYSYNTSKPTASTINVPPNMNLANGFCTAVGRDSTVSDAISIHANGTTHLILDLTAVVVGVGSVDPGILQTVGAVGAANAEVSKAEWVRRSKPSWEQ
ncbi:hypothetical protein [Micromonospora sp. NPDC050200]|uniref:hypothetical protein n=1 Tax=Micromonospora sp. NPDC050200 TaxID=3155664 RepID=UPI0033DAB291